MPVAVKVIRNEYPTARELARLRREFAILKELGDLPGVVHVYALEKCGRGCALVMEDIGTSSLNDWIKARRLDVEAALKIGISIADTLDSLHRREIIHKDIKPHNIMIDEVTSTPRLVDFGIAARLSRETANATSPALLEGTLAYMSPEQTGRMNRTVDRRTDLYSLGALIFELLTGAPPFAATDPTELIYSHIARSPAPPHEHVAEVPPALSEVVMKLLAKMPEERYQSARGVKADRSAQRSAQVLQVALEGAQRRQARVVILDITGIKQIDSYVVRALLQCASALRLLGTQAIITGIRAEVAQTMVALGTDLTAIITKATLQSGIAYALKLSAELTGSSSPASA